jgi:hypothetical protein
MGRSSAVTGRCVGWTAALCALKASLPPSLIWSVALSAADTQVERRSTVDLAIGPVRAPELGATKLASCVT